MLGSTILFLYLALEILFYFLFQFYLVPRANQRTRPQPFRDYGKDRNKLLIRILSRLQETSLKTGQDPRRAISEFILCWFHQPTNSQVNKSPPLLQRVSQFSQSDESSQSSSDDVNESDGSKEGTMRNQTWMIDGLGRSQMEEFLAWGFFGKHLPDLDEWESGELRFCFAEIERVFGLVFVPTRQAGLVPRCMTLEDMNVLHRPLLVYGFFALARFFGGILLQLLGYRRVSSVATDLVGWYRPARDKAAEKLLPLLFFHGIAPGGFLFYLPMVLLGLVADCRSVFLFENPSISCTIGFSAISEEQTVVGVTEIVERFEGKTKELALVGHSFGSCQLTWLLHSKTFRERIRQFVLLDPVTILLSEPDVMVNFLYNQDVSKIRMIASSELFTQFYLRRHFSWYNSELWLEEIPNKTTALVFLAEEDEIVGAPKVKQLIDLSTQSKEFVDRTINLTYWEKVGHAACVSSPAMWRQIKDRMLEDELKLAQT